jgi:tRNA threonylcarbamoyladenosine biosynthesis protein TsaB
VLILALDTTTRAGSVALVRDGAVIHEHGGGGQLTHGQRLPGALIDACRAARVEIADVTLLAVAAGPGSFTGLRIGIATMQGLAMARGARIVPVSALEALAVAAPGGSARVAAWMDAHRGEVFAQVFERDPGRASARPRTEAISGAPAAVLQRQTASLDATAFAGDGAVRYRELILAARGEGARIAPDVPRLAAAIGLIAAQAPERAVLPHAVVPIYVRKPDAELARDRRAAGA